jgi:hypothetical protein
MAVGVLAAAWGLPRGAAATVFLNAADWSTALSGEPVELLAFPAYTAVSTDAFSTPGASGSHAGGGGTFAGVFGCNSLIYPCSGAYQITYSLPFEIIGFGGQLAYNNGYLPTTPVFAVPLSPSNGYDGFYGELFAPTDELTLLWSPGLLSTDSFANFNFANAQIVRAVTEPAPLLLLTFGLLALGFHRGASARGRG